MIISHFLKSMKSFFKSHKLLSLLFLFFAIFAPILVVHSQLDSANGGWRVTSGTTNKIVTSSGYPSACFSNLSANDYFIPTKNAGELNSVKANLPPGLSVCITCGDAICNGTETCATCAGDCGICGRYRPYGIYVGSIARRDSTCGGSYPSCTFCTGGDNTCGLGNRPIASNNIGDSWLGGSCGFLQNYRYCKKYSLIGVDAYIYNGEACMMGLSNTNLDVNTDECVGTYNYAANTCVYASQGQAINTQVPDYTQIAATPSNRPLPKTYDGTNWVYDAVTTGSYGSCTTRPPCGDGICATGYGESCSTCVADCGVCPIYCGDYSCNGSEDCYSCPGDCGGCEDCLNVDCAMNNRQSLCLSSPCCFWTGTECINMTAAQ